MFFISNVLSLLIVWLVFKVRKKRLLAEVQLHKCNIKHLLAVALLGLGFSFDADSGGSIFPGAYIYMVKIWYAYSNSCYLFSSYIWYYAR